VEGGVVMHQAAPFALAPVAASVRPASVIVVDDPFTLELDARQARPVRFGQTLADLAPAAPGAWLCFVDGEAIPRALWRCMPRPGSVVQFRALPQGGGRGSNPLRTLLQIAAMVAINFLIPGSGFAMQLARIGATIAANALINNLVPLDQANAPGGGGGQQFNASAQGNLSRLGQPIPEIFGFDNGWPDLAAQPYSTYEDNEQYLHLLLIVGRGQYRIDRVSVGDTPITSFAEAQVVRVGQAQDTLDGPGSGVETLAELTLVDPLWVTSPDVSQVEMKTLDFVGPFAACTPERTVDRIGIDIALPRGLDSGRSISWRVETRPVNDFDQATGAWSTLASESYDDRSVLPVRLSYEYTVAAGRYQVRLVRTDVRATSDNSNHDISWLALRGHLVDADIGVDDCTFVAVRVRASGQLSGALRFRVMVRRMIPVWDGSAWSANQATRNPAWAFAEVLRARGVDDASIDLDQLLSLATTWTVRQDNFDHRFDTQGSVWDALALICKVGRAFPLIRGSKYTAVRDAAQTTPVAAYGMRNIRRGTLRMKPTLASADSMTTLDMEYWDHRRWGWVTVTAQIHDGEVHAYRGAAAGLALGLPAPDDNRRGRIKMPGIYGENHALRTVAYTLADRYYRSVEVEYDTELDGLLPAPLDLVVFQHDVGNFGQAGDVYTWTAGTLTLEATEHLSWSDDAAHAVRLQRPNGTLTDAIAVTRGADDATMVLAEAPDFTPVFDDAGRERTRYVFGPTAEVGALARLRAIRPSAERTIGHRIVLEDDRVHTVDNQWLPGDDEQDPLPDGTVIDDGGAGEAIVHLTDKSTGGGGMGAAEVDIQVTVHNDGTLEIAGTTIDPLTYPYEWLNPQPVTADVAALYEVMFSAEPLAAMPFPPYVLADIVFAGAALDTWHGLGTSRTVSASSPAATGGLWQLRITVQIREAATGLVQDSCVIDYIKQDDTA
jgi:hypothetical protein